MISKSIIIFVFSVIISPSAFAVEYLDKPPEGMSCKIISCTDVEKPINAPTWCGGFDDSVKIIPQEKNYVTPDSPPPYGDENIIDFSDGDQVAYIELLGNSIDNGRIATLAVYVNGYYWGKYYENYKLSLVCYSSGSNLNLDYDEFDGYARVKLRTMASFVELINQADSAGDLTKNECLSELAELNAMKARGFFLQDPRFNEEAQKLINSVSCSYYN